MKIHPLISVVVLGYNNFDRTTGPCLESLRPWFSDPELEFIVFDNASPDASGERTRQWCQQNPGVSFEESLENLGYAGGMNKAASFAQGQWLLLVNNDTEFPAGSLDAMKKTIRAAPYNLTMLGPITNAAGNGQRIYDPMKKKQEWLELGEWLNSHPTGLYIPTYRCDFFCIAIRRDVWNTLNGLDTIFGRGYYEDFDFSLRLRDAGFDQAITEDVFIYHQGSATFTGNPEQNALIKRNKNLMKQRHPNIKFQHVRKCNIDILKTYPLFSNMSQSKESLQARKKIRKTAAQLDRPKSLIKRLYWTWMLKKIELI